MRERRASGEDPRYGYSEAERCKLDSYAGFPSWLRTPKVSFTGHSRAKLQQTKMTTRC